MKTRNTPGPWEPSKQHGRPGKCALAQIFATHGEKLSIARIEPTADSAEASANATLMAAAPELLEALNTMYDCICIAPIDNRANFDFKDWNKKIASARTILFETKNAIKYQDNGKP